MNENFSNFPSIFFYFLRIEHRDIIFYFIIVIFLWLELELELLQLMGKREMVNQQTENEGNFPATSHCATSPLSQSKCKRKEEVPSDVHVHVICWEPKVTYMQFLIFFLEHIIFPKQLSVMSYIVCV